MKEYLQAAIESLNKAQGELSAEDSELYGKLADLQNEIQDILED